MKKYLRKKIRQLRGQIKRSDFLFSLRRRFVDHDLQREKKLMKTSAVKSPEKVRAEIADYRAYWHCRPDDYIRYGLFAKNLTRDEILDYVPMHYYYCDLYSALYDDLQRKDPYIEDKLVQYRKFIDRGIKIPRVVAIVHNGKLYDESGVRPLEWESLIESTTDGSRYFIKPVDGRCGVGISMVEKKNGLLYKGDKALHMLSDLGLDNATDYIIQCQLIQRQDLSAVNASTLNTLRTIVTYFDGKPDVVGIILRIGRASSFVDNSGQGGISVGVDIETGMFDTYAGREHGGGRFDSHPDTGFVFAGHGIADWDNVRRQIYDVVGRVSEYPMLGWDLAIGDDGVYAIEYNLGFGIEHAQTVMGGMRRRLGIDKRLAQQ